MLRLSCAAVVLSFFPIHIYASGSAWAVAGSKLSATVEILDLLPNGTIPLESGTRRIFLEVGANSEATMDMSELLEFPDAFLVSFEPLLHHYSALVARKTKASMLQRLGSHSDRGLVLPLAVSPQEGFAELRIAGPFDGCASLLHEHSARQRWDCANPKYSTEVRRVPAVSLHTVLGSWLAWEEGGGWPIDYLKVDAQGFDVEVVRSAGDELSRIMRVMLEVPRDGCERMYKGSLHCSEIIVAMKEMGFVPAYDRHCRPASIPCDKSSVQEEDWEFLRAGVRPLNDALRPFGDECWEPFVLQAEETKSLRDMCCGCAFVWAINFECFGGAKREDRCCATYNSSWSCTDALMTYGEEAIREQVRRLLG